MKHLEALISKRLSALLSPEDLLRIPGFESDAVSKLARYLDLLATWTKRVDLVTSGSPEELLEQHVLDCLVARVCILSELPLEVGGAVLDIGTGGGLPGLVWACLEPSRQFYLCEPREKRVVFLKEARATLGLRNVEVFQERMETLDTSRLPNIRLVTTRALGLRDEFVSHGTRLMPEGGVLCFLTGESFDSTGLEAQARITMVKEIKYLSTAIDDSRKLVLLNVSRETF